MKEDLHQPWLLPNKCIYLEDPEIQVAFEAP